MRMAATLSPGAFFAIPWSRHAALCSCGASVPLLGVSALMQTPPKLATLPMSRRRPV